MAVYTIPNPREFVSDTIKKMEQSDKIGPDMAHKIQWHLILPNDDPALKAEVGRIFHEMSEARVTRGSLFE